jgi:hypothetical protein
MSGIVGSRLNIRGSGIVAQLGTDGQVLTSAGAGVAAEYEDAAGGTSWQSVVTGSTMTAVAGNGYPINTTSNTCTITLPASASAGDTIVFADYARTWGTNKIIIDSNGLNYQSDDDTFDVEYTTDGQSFSITYMDATKGWVPTIDDAVSDAPVKGNAKGIFGYGHTGSYTAVTNLVSNTGVIGTDVSGVGTARQYLAACEYGGDKGIFGYGLSEGGEGVLQALSNLISNSGVVATDVTGVGTARAYLGACEYGGDKGIFAYGHDGGFVSMSNLVANTGVVATDTTGVGTARNGTAACEYGTNTAIFAYGATPSVIDESNLVSNTGVVATDTTGVGTDRRAIAACSYGFDKGIFGYGDSGSMVSMTNLVSNTGVVATDVTGVGTARRYLGACEYGYDKGIFAYGDTGSMVSMSNLVANTGVVATDVTGVGSARSGPAAGSYS